MLKFPLQLLHSAMLEKSEVRPKKKGPHLRGVLKKTIFVVFDCDISPTNLIWPLLASSQLWSLLPPRQFALLGQWRTRPVQDPLLFNWIQPQCDQLLLRKTSRGATGSSSLR